MDEEMTDASSNADQQQQQQQQQQSSSSTTTTTTTTTTSSSTSSSSTTTSAGLQTGKGAGTMIKDKGESLHWIEKYRPGRVEELIGQEHVVNTLKNLSTGGDLPHLLFYGPPGTGKTSTILAMAKEIYGTNWRRMILELNASDDRGISVVRDQIKSFAGTKQLFGTPGQTKLIILDEADHMTPPAQAALRRIIEKYTQNARFCMICNYLSKIIPALQSRCTRFRFQPLPSAAVESRLRQIVTAENVNCTDDGIKALVTLGHGDMRRSMNILQSVWMSDDEVSERTVYDSTGNPTPGEVKQIVNWLLEEPLPQALKQTQKMQLLKGLALADIITAVHAYALRLAITVSAKCALLQELANIEHRLNQGCPDDNQLIALVGAFSIARIQSSQQ